MVLFLPIKSGWATANLLDNNTNKAAPLPTPTVFPISLESKVHPNILTAFQKISTDKVPVIILLKDQVNFKELGFTKAQTLDQLKAQQDDVYNALTEKAQKTQGTVLSVLQGPVGSHGAPSDVVSFWIFNGVAATIDKQTMVKLAAMPEIKYIYDDRVIQIPPGEMQASKNIFSSTNSEVEWGVAKVGADKVWEEFKIDGSGIVVGIVDTGVTQDHYALKGKYRGNHTYHVYSWHDYVAGELKPYDDMGHGTHVAGIILGDAGPGNKIGIAPGAEWIAAKAFDEHGSGMFRGMAWALQWMMAPEGIPRLAPNIVNGSWGAPCDSDYFRIASQALRSVGIIPVFSAGNAGPDPETIGQPACFSESLAVGATDINDLIAEFSSRGPAFNIIKPDVSAPGVDIRSSFGLAYEVHSGTSMAAPAVSGTIALLLQAKPSLTPDQIIYYLQKSAVDLGSAGPDNDYGAGRIDAYQAVRMVLGGDSSPKQVSPNGVIPEREPSYKWETIQGATKYQLKVTKETGEVLITAWFNTSDVCSSSSCSVKPSKTLVPGNYKWQIQSASASGVGSWSGTMDFTVSDTALGAATLESPSGEITDPQPDFKWNVVENATKYQIKITDSAGTDVMSSWKESTAVCSGASCTIKADINLEAGDYTWQIQAANATTDGPWSSTLSFKVTVTSLGKAILVSPTGEISDKQPIYEWKPVEQATKYQLRVSDAAGKDVVTSWYDMKTICTTESCRVRTTNVLELGDYTWYVESSNTSGNGPWSDSQAFNVKLGVPSAPVLISPVGEISERLPVFQWKTINSVLSYHLKISNKIGTTIVDKTYQAGEICSEVTCLTKIIDPLSGGDYSWQVQAANTLGDSPWSEVMTFTLKETTPAQVVLVSPSGVISDSEPTYHWNVIADATEYRLRLKNSGGDIIRTWFETADVCRVTDCSVKPAAGLNAGTYEWQVQAYNEGGYGIWSDALSFNVRDSAPTVPIPLFPSGNIANSLPTMRWTSIIKASEYQIKILNASSNLIFSKWYLASNFCSGASCSAQLSSSLSGGDYTWQIQSSSTGGDSDWSEAMPFTVLDLPPGIATLLSPSGNITDPQPVYKWNVVEKATEYQLQVIQSSGEAVMRVWYQAGDICSSIICSVRPANTVAIGVYSWQVRSSSTIGSGHWSLEEDFIVSAPPLGAATPNAPSGEITNKQPPYQWTFVEGATQYQLKVIGPIGDEENIVQSRYQATDICIGIVCSVPQISVLSEGDYTWQVLTLSPASNGSWSRVMTFSIISQPAVTPVPTSIDSVPLPNTPTAAVTSAGYDTYTVKSGDYLAKLAKEWNISLEELGKINNITYPYIVYIGQAIKRPKPILSPQNTPTPIPTGKPLTLEKNYTVQAGDYLAKLARDWGISLQSLADLNNLKYPYAIFPGQLLKRP
jgi:subtilisin family serine protease/LysM repeat protein